MHRLLTSKEEADRIDHLLANVETATRTLDATMNNVRSITEQVKTGPGIAHAVLYDGELSSNAAGAVAELERDLRAVREGNGIARAIIYGDDKTQQIMSNVNAMSGDLRSIVAGIKAGKGTLGGLLVDPSIYEDLKSAIGNVERNEVLRALVRYSIKADESKPKALPSSTLASPEWTPARARRVSGAHPSALFPMSTKRFERHTNHCMRVRDRARRHACSAAFS